MSSIALTSSSLFSCCTAYSCGDQEAECDQQAPVTTREPAEDEEEEEELDDLPEAEKEADSLFDAKIMRSVGGMMLRGYVEDIDVGQRTGERLYRVRYEDGDLEHMTDVQLLQFVVLS